MLPDSLRGRLLAWLALLLTALLTGFGFTAYEFNRREQLQRVDEELARRVAAVVVDVRQRPGGPEPMEGRMMEPPPDGFGGGRRGLPPDRDTGKGERRPPPGGKGGPPERPGAPLAIRSAQMSAETLAMFDESAPGAPYYVIWGGGKMPLVKSRLAPATLPKPSSDDADSRTHLRTRDTTREAYFFTELGACVLAGIKLDEQLAALRRFALLLVGAGGIVLAVGLGGAWIVTSRAIRPVEEIGQAARRIADGNLAERIQVTAPASELGRLATVLNSTFARLEAAFAQQKNFAADASHELRTPLAVIITEAQTTLARERSTAEYKETLEGCLDSAQHMRRLTESLLALARFDAGQEQLLRQPIDLAEVARTQVAALRPLADQRGIALGLKAEPAAVHGDAERLGQVVANLVSNAIHYTHAQGAVRIETRSEGKDAVLVVSDNGPGIAPEDLPHVFERFYRADKARSRADGRSGLGLAICQAIVDAHGGTLAVESTLGAGARFIVRVRDETPRAKLQ